jgi:cell division protein FtsI (penicillin-binding protein 3)
MTARRKQMRFRGRNWLTRTLMMAVLAVLAGRALQLQVIDSDYLQQQGNSRYLRVVNEVPTRGMIVDRNNQPLAISTPVDSLWANPEVLSKHRGSVVQLARLLDTKVGELENELRDNRDKEFMYLKRQVSPQYAENVLQHDIPGVSVQREYRRYYPVGEAAGHVIGFSNIDDQGQEGAELLYNSVLTGRAGKSRVLKDRLGHTVEMVESLGLSRAGHNVQLSIDRRLQYLAYRELKRAVIQHHARAGTAVIVDIKTGEILAMVSQPSFNPNNRSDFSSNLVRNRAATDLYEPGSTLKPFTIAAALEEHLVKPSSTFDTSPGYITIDSRTIRDARDHGRLTVSGIIKKSSNVGAARIALKIPSNKMHDNLLHFGFTRDTGAHIPGEAEGQLMDAARWTRVDQASLAFGYGISITSLQLARAYAALANDGLMVPLSLEKLDQAPVATRVISKKTARLVRSMLEGVVAPGGTGTEARVPYYQVAGKTGTVHKFINGAYSEDHYLALFAGYAPASHPRLAMVVTVDDPTKAGYYGGLVAAPVFSRVMGGALRLLNVMPDEPGPNLQHFVKAQPQEAG